MKGDDVILIVSCSITADITFADNTIEYTGDFILSKANKLTFDKNTIKANDIKFDSPKISLSDGTWNFNNMIFSNEEQPIKKISFKNMKFE